MLGSDSAEESLDYACPEVAFTSTAIDYGLDGGAPTSQEAVDALLASSQGAELPSGEYKPTDVRPTATGLTPVGMSAEGSDDLTTELYVHRSDGKIDAVLVVSKSATSDGWFVEGTRRCLPVSD